MNIEVYVSFELKKNFYIQHKQQMLAKMLRKGNPLTLLEGMQSSTTTMENSVEIP